MISGQIIGSGLEQWLLGLVWKGLGCQIARHSGLTRGHECVLSAAVSLSETCELSFLAAQGATRRGRTKEAGQQTETLKFLESVRQRESLISGVVPGRQTQQLGTTRTCKLPT